MKKFALFLLFLCVSLPAFTQSYGADFLGIWCYVDVDLKNDPRVRQHCQYEISTSFPNEWGFTLAEGQEKFCYGPGSPRLFCRDGKTYLDLWLLEIETELAGAEYGQMDVDVWTDCRIPTLGTSGDAWITEGYYTIKLVIKNTDY